MLPASIQPKRILESHDQVTAKIDRLERGTTSGMKELKIALLERQIEEAGDIDDRTREANRVLPQISAEESLCRATEESIFHQFKDGYERRNGGPPSAGAAPITIRSERAVAVLCTAGGVAAVAVDSALSAVLGKSWFSVSGSGAILVGAGIAVALSFAAKGGIIKVVVQDERPKTTRRRIWRLTLASLVSTIGLAWIVLASRNPSENLVDFLVQYVGLTLAALNLSLAFFAGTLFVAASEYNWSFRAEASFRKTRLRLGELSGFKKWVESFLKGREGQQ